MLSFGLKPWKEDDAEEGVTILKAFEEDDVEEEAQAKEEKAASKNGGK